MDSSGDFKTCFDKCNLQCVLKALEQQLMYFALNKWSKPFVLRYEFWYADLLIKYTFLDGHFLLRTAINQKKVYQTLSSMNNLKI